jgi:hypothetical protein
MAFTTVIVVGSQNRAICPQPLFASLAHLATKCTSLTELSLTLHGELPPKQKRKAIAFHGLLKLDLQITNIKRHKRVVHILDGLFPKLVDFNILKEKDRDLICLMIKRRQNTRV